MGDNVDDDDGTSRTPPHHLPLGLRPPFFSDYHLHHHSSPLIAKDAAFPPYWCENSAVTGKQPLDSFSRSHRAEPRTTEAPTSATTITAQDTRRRETRAGAKDAPLQQPPLSPKHVRRYVRQGISFTGHRCKAEYPSL